MTALEDDVEQLLILTPYLDAALAADEGGPAEADRIAAGIDPALRLPVDGPTLLALAALAREVPRAARWAALVVSEIPAPRDVRGHLRHLPRLHERMLVTAAVDEAESLAAVVASLLAQVRLALGLRTPAHRLGQFCPMHDDPLTELIVPGDEGQIRMNRGRVIGVDWTRHTAAVCRTCNASWPPGDYLSLGRLCREADQRRTASLELEGAA